MINSSRVSAKSLNCGDLLILQPDAHVHHASPLHMGDRAGQIEEIFDRANLWSEEKGTAMQVELAT